MIKQQVNCDEEFKMAAHQTMSKNLIYIYVAMYILKNIVNIQNNYLMCANYCAPQNSSNNYYHIKV